MLKFSCLKWAMASDSTNQREHPLETKSVSNFSQIRWTHVSANIAPAPPPPNTENWIPSRLLDVDSSSSEPHSVNLVERDKVRELHKNEAIPYLTLSHVWGDESFFTLTESNIQDVKAGVSLQSLRPCFRDAIRITRWLGKRYLWIDSLW